MGATESAWLGILMVVLGAAIVVVMAWLLYPRGREPGPRLPAAVFAAAFLAVIPAGLLLALVAAPLHALPPVPRVWVNAFVTAALPEEALKATLLWVMIYRPRLQRYVQDGPFYGVIAGMGFGLIENMLYVGMSAMHGDGADQTAYIRTIASGPGHAFDAAIVGYHLALASLQPAGRRAPLVARGMLIAVLFHGFFDLPLMAAVEFENDWYALPALLVVFGSAVAAFWVLDRARRLDDRRLAEAAKRRGTGPLGPRGTGKLGGGTGKLGGGTGKLD